MTKRRLQRPVESGGASREWTGGEEQKGEMKEQEAVAHRASEFPVWEVETVLTCLGSINTATNGHQLGPGLTHILF